jgi:phosphonate metabolism transcriptional regulator PhnF
MPTIQAAALDRTSPVPLYFQIAQGLQKAIDEGALKPGDRLEAELELADRLGVSRPTVRQAVERLVQQGLVARHRGVGTVVVHRRIQRPLALTSFYDDLAAADRKPTTALLALDDVPAEPEVATALSVAVGAPVLWMERLRSAEGVPLAVMSNYLPVQLLYTALLKDDLESQGLYELLRAQGVQLHSAKQVIAARRATSREARLLGEPRSNPVLTVVRTSYDATGRAVEFGRHVYPADRYAFELSLFGH